MVVINPFYKREEINENKWFFWKTAVIPYVWSSSNKTNTRWPNPYAPGNAIIVPVNYNKN
ncbi:MAG: DUF3047 domain-containing protein [Victivallales bacterium]|nr:DUF3047 domain-containing protein [Victivallales bacterium]